MMVEDVNGHDLQVGDVVEVVDGSAAQKIGLRARVSDFRGPPGHVEMRWNEHFGGGANVWVVKGEHVRFVERHGHDCAMCAVVHVHGL